MTTKRKIIFGFVIMIILVCGLSVLGYMSLQSASGGLETYRRHARLNTATSDMDVNISDVIANSLRFINNPDPKHIDAALADVAAYEKMCRESLAETNIEFRKTKFTELLAVAGPLKKNLGDVRDNILDVRKLFEEKTRPAYRDVYKKLTELAEASHDTGNAEVPYIISMYMQDLAWAMISLARFTENFEVNELTLVNKRIDDLQIFMDKLSVAIKNTSGRETFNALYKSYKAMDDSLDALLEKATATEKSLASLNRTAHELNESITSFSKLVADEAGVEVEQTLASNSAAERLMLLVSGVGLLFGALLAIFIVVGIVKILNTLAHFSHSVAQGNFDYPIKSREKGEVGVMISSIREIPTILTSILTNADDLADDIGRGKLRNRLQAENFKGSFAHIAHAINTVGDAYTKILDSVPTPIMACDNTLSINFLNSAAQTVLGGNFVDSKCSGHLCAEICDTDKCIGKNCMASKASVTSETAMNPRNQHLDASITAIPLTDEKNEVVAYIEVVTDLTSIKNQQRTMMNVANEASALSSRIAAASEELSAQVEQVSRGAEMQKARVESTAAAMNEMNSTVIEVAKNAGQASEQSEQTRTQANEGANLVDQVVKSINEVNAVATTLQGKMHELGVQAESIGGVMNVISDIADQTNLLALNAAIEAARAGEAGRGFAVVADEVRKLAEKTMTATQEVGSNITAIQNSARTNIDEVGSAVSHIAEATELANSSGEALHGIVQLAAANSSIVTSIATAAEEQSATSEEINRSISEINQVVGETTEGMMQSSAAVQELSKVAQELRRVMEGLK